MFDEASRYGIVIRLLADNERRRPIARHETPLVVEAAPGASIESFEHFIDHYSTDVISSITQHGAVLFRGFMIQSPAEFERACLRVRGFQGINEIFMSEAGRTRVQDTKCVLHTNTLYKTGGSFSPFSFHTENFYVPDVPRYISFLCQRASWLGGETGLIDMTALYEDLSDDLKSALCRHAYQVTKISGFVIQQRYGLTEEEFVEFFSENGFTVQKNNGCWDLLIHKPCVLVHPETGLPSLQINLAGELNSRGLMYRALHEFRSDFSGTKWLMHRMCWKHPIIPRLGHFFKSFFRSPTKAIKQIRLRQASRTSAAGAPSYPRIADCFQASDIRQLAMLMRRHYASFRWQSGDILMVDNLRMAHAGMPGFGPRDLKAMICNRIPVPCAADSPGCYRVPQNLTIPSVCETLQAWRERWANQVRS